MLRRDDQLIEHVTERGAVVALGGCGDTKLKSLRVASNDMSVLFSQIPVSLVDNQHFDVGQRVALYVGLNRSDLDPSSRESLSAWHIRHDAIDVPGAKQFLQFSRSLVDQLAAVSEPKQPTFADAPSGDVCLTAAGRSYNETPLAAVHAVGVDRRYRAVLVRPIVNRVHAALDSRSQTAASSRAASQIATRMSVGHTRKSSTGR
jgi:hypothetical protein